jgi:hypothetical protein
MPYTKKCHVIGFFILFQLDLQGIFVRVSPKFTLPVHHKLQAPLLCMYRIGGTVFLCMFCPQSDVKKLSLFRMRFMITFS